MNLIRALLLRLGILLLFLLGTIAFLTITTPGVKISLNLANLLLPGTLKIEKLEGHLWHRMAFDSLTYTHQQQRIILKNTQFKWHVAGLYPLNIQLEAMNIQHIQLHQDQTEIALEQLKLSGDFKHGLHLNGGTRVILPQGILHINIATADDAIISHVHLGRNHIILKGPLNGPWHVRANLSDLKQLDPALTPLESKLTANATIYDMQHAVLIAQLEPGRFRLPTGSTPDTIPFKGVSLKASLNPEALTLNTSCQIDSDISGRLQLKLPGIQLNKAPLPTQAITGQAQLTVASLAFLEDISQLSSLSLMFQKPTGKINATLDIAGHLNQPKLTGHIALTEGKVTLPDLGLTLNPVELTLKTDGTHWESHGIIQPNNSNPLTLSGNGSVTPALTGTAVLEGNQVTFINTPEYFLKASPNLIFTAKPDGYNIDGSLLIPEAKITPLSFTHTEKLTRDVVYTQEESNPNPFNLTANVALDMGQNVQINLKGIQGYIDGMLHIKQLPKQALTAVGELKLRDGRYEAYGQQLDIEQGDLIFMGQQIDNPNIRVRAIRHFTQTNTQFSGSNQLFDFSAENLNTPNLGNNTTVGITVSGRIDLPNVKLFSSPPNLSQADILSMLLLGEPADQASKSGSQVLIQAITAMHLNSGSKGVKMVQDLQKKLGIDFDVQNKSMGTESSDFSKTSVSVGKSITKRIYLQYNVGLFQENSSVFTLTYLLNKFLSLKVTASDIGNGIDFMYSHSD
ncbi:MAG: translocation/assembly module TamB domain-containing protein [Gammaproteobacteria bacterium]|nr:translocation/assembly module TamB domain-containing protein [Gammaproteobacteria bacterium]